ncbi:YifB family Mg chelatase-like AAA ATPase [Pandoraea terrigena]|uniref:ATP-dependent protease n=1 Tax=Pandoraea terrigena TaxID=2508292 RepID=A0A5E4S059_9BURK|nr:YifB family Mg chelatase-like AAA ATPase [Pandoraea terrigena]VVD69146.1 ATP-dependent protease [Pandoraea terrigena]
MSLAVVSSRAITGMAARAVTVEVHLANGLPGLTLVGLPDTEVKESRERVRSALQNSRFEFPARRITVNLAPADLPKASGGFDLPIALGILAASGQLPEAGLRSHEFAGELSLTGELRPVRGALAMASAVLAESSARALVLPAGSAQEAAWVEGATVYGARTLLDVCAHLAEPDVSVPLPRAVVPLTAADAASADTKATQAGDPPDLGDIKGQEHAKRALEVAAAGGHHILFYGPPGTGKSMLATRLAGLLPALSKAQAVEAATLASLSAQGFDLRHWGRRPFRAPHHTASAAALVGGGSVPRPGEISLAHRGVLFLDELPEFQRRVLEVLREPLEVGHVTISRAGGQATFPAAFQLVAAMNPCPCGNLGHPSRSCRCTGEAVARYRNRLSGPLLDRIDLHVEVPALRAETFAAPANGERSEVVAARVGQARERQLSRQGQLNCGLSSRSLEVQCALQPDARDVLHRAVTQHDWSARTYHRVLRVARTVADLAGSVTIDAHHVAEATQYREAPPS